MLGQLEQADEVTVLVVNTATGFEEAWRLMHDRVPSVVFDRQRRTRGHANVAPQRDPDVSVPYLAAQRAVRRCYHQLLEAGVTPFWRSETTYGPNDLIEALLLCGVLGNIVRHSDRLDTSARQDLRTAQRKLKPFWREPPPLRKCRTCRDNPAAGDRRDCWTCASKRRTKRQVRVRRRHR